MQTSGEDANQTVSLNLSRGEHRWLICFGSTPAGVRARRTPTSARKEVRESDRTERVQSAYGEVESRPASCSQSRHEWDGCADVSRVPRRGFPIKCQQVFSRTTFPIFPIFRAVCSHSGGRPAPRPRLRLRLRSRSCLVCVSHWFDVRSPRGFGGRIAMVLRVIIVIGSQ